MKIHFRKIGEGKPVVILHGLFGSSDNWQSFAKELSVSGYAVYLVDLRNHGQSGHDSIMDYKALSEDIAELFADANLKGSALIGHSLGGKTAMTFAFNNAEVLNSLIVIDIAPRQYPVQNKDILDALLAIDTTKIKSRKEIESELATYIHDTSTLQFLLKNLYWKEKDRLDWRFNLDAIKNFIEHVGSRTAPNTIFKKPTLFIRGENSKYISPSDETEMKELFENVSVKTAPGAGHWVHADNPQWLLSEVKTFLSNTFPH